MSFCGPFLRPVPGRLPVKSLGVDPNGHRAVHTLERGHGVGATQRQELLCRASVTDDVQLVQ
jgi:hypothetical protein